MTIEEKIESKIKKKNLILEDINKKQQEIKKIEAEIKSLNKLKINEVLEEFNVSSAEELKKILKSVKLA